MKPNTNASAIKKHNLAYAQINLALPRFHFIALQNIGNCFFFNYCTMNCTVFLFFPLDHFVCHLACPTKKSRVWTWGFQHACTGTLATHTHTHACTETHTDTHTLCCLPCRIQHRFLLACLLLLTAAHLNNTGLLHIPRLLTHTAITVVTTSQAPQNITPSTATWDGFTLQ